MEPEGADEGAVLFYVHGGGFVGGSFWTHRKLVGHLAAATGARALLASYGYVPEHRYPVQVEQVTRAYEWVLDQGIAPGTHWPARPASSRTLRCSRSSCRVADEAIRSLADWVRPKLLRPAG